MRSLRAPLLSCIVDNGAANSGGRRRRGDPADRAGILRVNRGADGGGLGDGRWAVAGEGRPPIGPPASHLQRIQVSPGMLPRCAGTLLRPSRRRLPPAVVSKRSPTGRQACTACGARIVRRFRASVHHLSCDRNAAACACSGCVRVQVQVQVGEGNQCARDRGGSPGGGASALTGSEAARTSRVRRAGRLPPARRAE